MQKIERSIIGSILLKPDMYFEICEVVKPFMFKYETALAELVWGRLETNETLDLRLLSQEAKKKNINFSYSITSEANTNRIGAYAKAVFEAYVTGEEIRIRGESVAKLMQGENYEVVNLQETQEREKLSLNVDEAKSRFDAIANTLENIRKAMNSDGGVTGIDTGYKDLNSITGGWQRTDQVIIGARPGMGKTVVGLSYAVNAAKVGTPVLFISLEMSETQLFERAAAIYAGVTTEKMRNGKLEESEFKSIEKALTEQIYELPLYFEDSTFTISSILNKIRVYKRKYNIGMVVIDYLGLIDSGNDRKSTNDQISMVSRKLKQVAATKDCNVVMLTLSQLNRGVEQRADKRPILADLRDSGSIEQDADMVQFIYRDSYYNPESEDKSSEIIIKKNRHGRLTTLKRIFDYPYAEFLEPGRLYDTKPTPF